MRKHLQCLGLLALVLLPAFARAQTQPDPTKLEFFEQKIRLLLSEHCFECHSVTGKDIKGELRLDTGEGLLKGGEGGPVLVPGKPDESRLIRAVRHTGELKMPPKSKLSDQQINDLTEWVRQGATVPTAAPVPVAPARQEADLTELRKSWQYQPPKDHPVPPVKNAAWPKSPIDQFILARLEEKGLSPAQPADKRTLIRRATIDLTGLPPTPEEV